MEINYLYQLEWVRRMTGRWPDGAVLDFGCGSGEVVQACLRMGYDAYGTDLLHPGTIERKSAEDAGLFGTRIRPVEDGRICFEDEYFSFVMCNQVFEHVHDLRGALQEVARVLKRGGWLLSLYPTMETLWEWHIGIPCAHWFPVQSRCRGHYVRMMRRLGLGSFKGDLDAAAWARKMIDWMDDNTVYRSRNEILEEIRQHFTVEKIEWDYLKFRFGSRNRHGGTNHRWLPNNTVFRTVGEALYRKLCGMVIMGAKK
jgi:SAM-dependent methyltransferase